MRASFGVAGRRLATFVRQGALRTASEAAYQNGLDAGLRAGPCDHALGQSKLVRVQYAKPAQCGSVLRVPLRWQATGPAGELLSVLDADLTLSSHGDGWTQLRLDGSYRAPFGQDVVLDQAVLSRIAAASIGGLLDGVADAIADPAPEPPPGTEPMIRRWHAADTAEF